MKKNYNLFRRMLMLLCIGMSSLMLYSQTEINSRAALEAIANDLNGNYKLTANIDLSGADWAPLGSKTANFTGTLDGNGFVISGIRYNRISNDGSDYPAGSRKVGLFSVLGGSAVVKNLGIEKANIIGGKHVGGIAGTADGTVRIENCFVNNSYIETADHGGAIVGNMLNGATVINCYSNSEIYSRGAQASGLVGMFIGNETGIYKSYFSGIVRSGNPSGIGAWVDGGNPKVEYVVNLAPYILGAGNLRVNVGGGTARMGLYSLSTTILDGDKNKFSGTGTVPTGDSNYGSTNRHGENIPGGDNNAKSAGQVDFYQNVLGWDFENTWKFLGDGYPVLKWQTGVQPISVIRFLNSDKSVNENGIYPLNPGESIDLSGLLVLNQGVDFTLTSTSDKITIADKTISLDAGVVVSALENITVKISPVSSDFSCSQTLKILLAPADGVIQISTVEQLLGISSLPSRKYELIADLDMTGVAFNGIGSDANPFTGTFNGNGHVIKGLKFSNVTADNVGLFRVTNGAIISKLGIENAFFNGNNDVAGFVGKTSGPTTIEECYISNSYIEGRDHIASIVGGLNNGSVVRNCYSTARVHTREHQAGGLSGTMKRDTRIENSYFSGMVSNPSNRAVGIGGFHDDGDAPADHYPTISNSVSLAPYLLSGAYVTDAMRILHNFGGSRPANLINNYGLSTTWTGRLDFSQGGVVLTSDTQYGLDKCHGANVSPEDAHTQAFYETTLSWDFTNTWKMLSNGYPVLKWQTTPIAASVLFQKDSYNLEKDNAEGLNLSTIVPNTHGLILDVTADPAKVTVDGSTVKVASAWNEPSAETTTATLSLTSTDFTFANATVNLNLIPAVTLSDLSIGGTTIEGFSPFKSDYEIYVDGATESIDLGAVASNASNTIPSTDLGVKALNVGQNSYTVTVATPGGYSKSYNIFVHRGLISVSNGSGIGKRIVNIHSATGGASDTESPFKLLLGEELNKQSNDNKWCPTSSDNQPYVIFALADIYAIGAIEIRDKGLREGIEGQIDAYKVEVSMDAANWTEVVNATGEQSITQKYKEFPLTEARYVKFTPTKAAGYGAAWIYGFDIYGTFVKYSDETIVSRGKTVVEFNGSYSDRERASNIIDGVEENVWADYADENEDMTVLFDLEEVFNMDRFTLSIQNQADHYVTGASIYVSNSVDGSWDTPAYEFTTDVIDQVVTLNSGLLYPVAGQYIKIVFPASARMGFSRIREFEAHKSLAPTGTSHQSESNTSVYLNANNRIVIESQDLGSVVSVFNALGQKVASQTINSTKTEITTNLKSGVYIVNSKNYSTKIFVK